MCAGRFPVLTGRFKATGTLLLDFCGQVLAPIPAKIKYFHKDHPASVLARDLHEEQVGPGYLSESNRDGDITHNARRSNWPKISVGRA